MSDWEKPVLESLAIFWLHVYKAETEKRRVCASRNGASEREKGHNSNRYAYARLFA